MLPSTTTETHVLISICTPQKAYPRLHDAILSTKYFDDESELAYYGYRYYSPEMGRWVSRDPIQERAGHNLYGFVNNGPATRFDFLGLRAPESYYFYGWILDEVSFLVTDAIDGSGNADNIAFGEEVRGRWRGGVLYTCECPYTEEENREFYVEFRTVSHEWLQSSSTGPIAVPSPSNWWDALWEIIKALLEEQVSDATMNVPPDWVSQDILDKLDAVKPTDEPNLDDLCPDIAGDEGGQ